MLCLLCLNTYPPSRSVEEFDRERHLLEDALKTRFASEDEPGSQPAPAAEEQTLEEDDPSMQSAPNWNFWYCSELNSHGLWGLSGLGKRFLVSCKEPTNCGLCSLSHHLFPVSGIKTLSRNHSLTMGFRLRLMTTTTKRKKRTKRLLALKLRWRSWLQENPRRLRLAS